MLSHSVLHYQIFNDLLKHNFRTQY